MRYHEIMREARVPQITKDFVRRIESTMREIDSDYYQRTLAEAYGEHVGDQFDYDEIEHEPAFQRWLQTSWPKTLTGYVRNITRHFQTLASLTVFRAMTLAEPTLTGLQAGDRLGVYWTDTEQSAQRYWDASSDAHGGETFVFKATTEAVDWQTTIALQIINDAESEVRLQPNGRVTLLQIVRQSGEVVRADLHGVVFRA
jgi:hypothetical protein